jgi:transposase-like protein
MASSTASIQKSAERLLESRQASTRRVAQSITAVRYTLALRNITKEWKMSAREWKSAMTQFAILFPERFVQQL